MMEVRWQRVGAPWREQYDYTQGDKKVQVTFGNQVVCWGWDGGDS